MTHNKLHRSSADIQDAIARTITAHLSESSNSLPHDISEQLKVARMRALSRRKLVTEAAPERFVLGHGSDATWGLRAGFWGLLTQLGSWLPLLALVTGMVVIGNAQEDWTAQEIADVDTELLTDALPPAAYTDPGFAQFLRNTQEK